MSEGPPENSGLLRSASMGDEALRPPPRRRKKKLAPPIPTGPVHTHSVASSSLAANSIPDDISVKVYELNNNLDEDEADVLIQMKNNPPQFGAGSENMENLKDPGQLTGVTPVKIVVSSEFERERRPPSISLSSGNLLEYNYLSVADSNHVSSAGDLISQQPEVRSDSTLRRRKISSAENLSALTSAIFDNPYWNENDMSLESDSEFRRLGGIDDNESVDELSMPSSFDGKHSFDDDDDDDEPIEIDMTDLSKDLADARAKDYRMSLDGVTLSKGLHRYRTGSDQTHILANTSLNDSKVRQYFRRQRAGLDSSRRGKPRNSESSNGELAGDHDEVDGAFGIFRKKSKLKYLLMSKFAIKSNNVVTMQLPEITSEQTCDVVIQMPARLSHPFDLNSDIDLEIQRLRAPELPQVYRSLDIDDYSPAVSDDVSLDPDTDYAGKPEMDEQATMMSRIESLFPNDHLSLNMEASAKKKPRRRSSVPSSGLLRPFRGRSAIASAEPKVEYVSRKFIFESPVHLTVGLQTQDRYLFLFNDLIFIAKQKTPTSFKLKNRVVLADLWITDNNLAEVAEGTVAKPDRSFIMGWPTTNVLATFSSKEVCQQWREKLRDQVLEEKDILVSTLNMSIRYKNSSDHKVRQLIVGKEEEARDVMKHALQLFNIPSEQLSEFQLWVKSSREDSAYPLFGHELPYSIQACHDRETRQEQPAQCEFFLCEKNKKQMKPGSDLNAVKKPKKRLILHKFLKRPVSKSGHQTSKVRSPPVGPTGPLFGHSLQSLCETNHGQLPAPLQDLLETLYHVAAFTPEIFRKNCNDRRRKEVCAKLNSSDPEGWNKESHHPFVLAAILKQFLRELPDSLFHFDSATWLEIIDSPDENTRCELSKRLIDQLPAENQRLLRQVIAILFTVHQRQEETLMNAYNLSVCLGPSLLWPRGREHNPDYLRSATAQRIPHLVAYLIDNTHELFGQSLLVDTFGGPPNGRQLSAGSGSEDSGSEGHTPLTPIENTQKRPRHGIDTYEAKRAVFEEEEQREGYTESLESLSEHEPRTLSQMSPSSCSRDSGLILSENQEEDYTFHHHIRRASHGGSKDQLNMTNSSPATANSSMPMPMGMPSSKSQSCDSLATQKVPTESALEEPSALRRSGGKPGQSTVSLSTPNKRPMSLESRPMKAISGMSLEDDEDSDRAKSFEELSDPTMLKKSSSGMHLVYGKDVGTTVQSSNMFNREMINGNRGGRLQRKLSKLATLYQEIGNEEDPFFHRHSDLAEVQFTTATDSSPSDTEGPVLSQTLPVRRIRRNSNPSTPIEKDEASTGHFTFDLTSLPSDTPSHRLSSNSASLLTVGRQESAPGAPTLSVTDTYDRVTIRHLTPVYFGLNTDEDEPSPPPQTTPVLLASSAMSSHNSSDGKHEFPKSPQRPYQRWAKTKSASYSELLPTKSLALSAAPPVSPGEVDTSTNPPMRTNVLKRQVITKITTKPGMPRSKTVTTITSKPATSSSNSASSTPEHKPIIKSKSNPMADPTGESPARPRQPPNYAETLHRQHALKAAAESATSNKNFDLNNLSDVEIIKQTLNSRLAKNMYQNSLQAYEKQQQKGHTSTGSDVTKSETMAKTFKANLQGSNSQSGEKEKTPDIPMKLSDPILPNDQTVVSANNKTVIVKRGGVGTIPLTQNSSAIFYQPSLPSKNMSGPFYRPKHPPTYDQALKNAKNTAQNTSFNQRVDQESLV